MEKIILSLHGKNIVNILNNVYIVNYYKLYIEIIIPIKHVCKLLIL